MPSVSTLRTTMGQLRLEQESKQKLASELYARAETHEANGDTARGRLDRESAERYQADADRLANQASSIEIEIQARQRRAAQIEHEIEDFKKHADRELQKLIQKRDELVG